MDYFPVPDFGTDDFCYEPEMHCMEPISAKTFTAEEYDSLCTNQGLVVDTMTPIKCTANSTVYAAKSPSDGKKWAVKLTEKKKTIEQEFAKRKCLCDSPYLLKSVALRQSPRKALLQMELCENGDIRDLKLTEDDVWKLIHDIGHALAIIHRSGWMHLDVSPGNILIGSNCFKLSDFGTLAPIGSFEEGMEGAGPYVSPEALQFPAAPVTPQTDIFSFGVVLLEAITGLPAPRGGSSLYLSLRNDELKLGIGRYAPECSDELKTVINAMLARDPNMRPTAEQLCMLPKVTRYE